MLFRGNLQYSGRIPLEHWRVVQYSGGIQSAHWKMFSTEEDVLYCWGDIISTAEGYHNIDSGGCSVLCGYQ